MLPKNNLSCVNIDINEILTSKTCAHIIIEIIKFLAYQKLQIPYTFDILKYIVQKKRISYKSNANQSENLQSKNYFRLASSAVDSLEVIFQNIVLELESEDPPHEVLVLWGSVPMCPKEVYSICVPPGLGSHFYKNHLESSHKLVMKTLRQITFSQEILTIVQNSMAPTNMFVLLKRNHTKQNLDCSAGPRDFFLPTNSYQFPLKTPQIRINLNYDYCQMTEKCCKNMQIFSEFPEILKSKKSSSNQDCDGEHRNQGCDGEHRNQGCDGEHRNQGWFQGKLILKGFKDCCVNGKSVTDSWL